MKTVEQSDGSNVNLFKSMIWHLGLLVPQGARLQLPKKWGQIEVQLIWKLMNKVQNLQVQFAVNNTLELWLSCKMSLKIC